jgi:membrane-bound lytic murein transglycosylase D
LLRNKLYLLAIMTLTACAPMAVQHSVEGTPQTDSQAVTQQPASTPAAKAIQQTASALKTEGTQTGAVTGQAATQLNQTAAAPIIATVAPISVPFLAADGSGANQIDVWQRIRNGYAMREQESKLITSYEQWYARKPDYVARMTDRARLYLFFIVEEVEKRGMPTEIALLPMIESAFNPGAYSTARASGIWQFIPSTGKDFGMQQNWWYDGRRDVISATKGALDYLQKLHDQFGEWDLALAAYNCGENCVMRAQARNHKLHLPTNYASLRLPKETRSYVPKLLAVKNIISHPKSFDLALTDVPNKPYFAEVSTSRHIDLQLAADMAGISVEEFIALNPAHNRPVILQKGKDVLLLPVDHVETFRANLERANQPLVSWQACPTKKGENLDDLASRYGITTEKLKSINSLARNIKVSNGQTLLVPLNGEEAEIEFAAFNTNLAPADQKMLNAVRHTVRRGDTLGSIARRYHVQLASLKSWNKGVKVLRPGQHILVAQTTQTAQASQKTRKAQHAQKPQTRRVSQKTLTRRASKPNRSIKTSTPIKKAKRRPANT